MSRMGGPPSCISLPNPGLPEGLGTWSGGAAEAQTSRTTLALVHLGGSPAYTWGKGHVVVGQVVQRVAQIPTDGISLL